MPKTFGPLLEHLPAIYHSSEQLRHLLSFFEEVLFGPGKNGFKEFSEGLEQTIANIPSLFNPDSTRREFLPWLAQWVALGQYQGLPEKKLRALMARIVPLYGQRGTKRYLTNMLQFFIPENATITINDQELPSLIVGISKVGLDSRLGGDMPFWFLVKIRSRVSTTNPEEREKLRKEFEKSARSVIDLAKPAHTTYQLAWEFEDRVGNYH